MARLPNYRNQVPQDPRPPRTRWRPRTSWIYALLGIIVATLVLRNARLTFSWDDILRANHIPPRSEERYRDVASLAVLVFGAVAIAGIVHVTRRND